MVPIRSEAAGEFVINTVDGRLTSEEIIAYVTENIESWVGKAVIWDLNQADLGQISIIDWANLPGRLAALVAVRKGEKSALVAADDMGYGMIRMFDHISQMLSLPLEFRSFRTISQAKEWLLASRSE